ncbi:UPF0149 family protein [Vibrio ostreicida]|uniref:UPF0149 family protein n=1 Tax=Vibrio ostreicida TaxID=526588 RepID=A0ABT8BU84_9VIBR|nr:UPF0149 family protein [Vibrio ostreicida]MDN3609640.1 UPF0149 family protein [Vibrio ostreicida]NPD09529.1 UPF0149 family protein [Vibrio ostreicida]
MTLQEILSLPELENKLINQAKTHGFVAAMAAAPHVLPPEEWLAFLWGGEEVAPFADGEQLETYIELVIAIWNQYRAELMTNEWQWPESCVLDEEEIISQSGRDFCEGLLQGWQLARDDWETIMPEDSEDNALLGGVLLSISMLYDPETSLATLSDQGVEGLEQFEEIFNAVPAMLCGLAMRGAILADAQ